MDGVSKSKFSILAGILFSVLILGLGSFAQEAEAGVELPPARGDMIMFSSGEEEDVGDLDLDITVQSGFAGAGFGVPIVDVCINEGNAFPVDGNAVVVLPFVATPDTSQEDWKANLDVSVDPDQTAKYVSNSPTGNEIAGGAATALYSHTFDFFPAIFPINRATLDFHYLSDNDLGVSPENIGLLLNCVPIPISAMTSDGGDVDGEKPFFTEDQFEGTFDITDSLIPGGENVLQIYLRNHGAGSPAGIQYKFVIGFDLCAPGQEIEINEEEELLECVGGTSSGNSGHEPPTIGKSYDGVRQVVDGGMAIDDQTWTVTQGYHQEFELLQMLTSSHTISNVINCAKGVVYCNYIAVGFMGLTDDFNNPLMTVSASKDHLGDWTIDWYDPDDYISDPDDATPADIVFVPQIIDDKLLGTSFTIDFKNKDTGQLKIGIQVRDSYGGVRNFFFNEGVEFIDADAYPAVETAYESPVEVESVCFGQNNPDRNSCQFAKMKDWATENAEETLRQMTNNQHQYDQ